MYNFYIETFIGNDITLFITTLVIYVLAFEKLMNKFECQLLLLFQDLMSTIYVD